MPSPRDSRVTGNRPLTSLLSEKLNAMSTDESEMLLYVQSNMVVKNTRLVATCIVKLLLLIYNFQFKYAFRATLTSSQPRRLPSLTQSELICGFNSCIDFTIFFTDIFAVHALVLRIRNPKIQLECGPMPNLMVALPNIGGALCSTSQSLADAHY